MTRLMTPHALRVVAATALGLPLTLAVGGIAGANPVQTTTTTPGHECDGYGPSGPSQVAAQGGDLVGVLGQVNPALNAGGILTGGTVTQVAGSQNSANSGIHQSGGGHGPSGGQESFQAGDLVGALVQANPAANVGGILTKGDVTQVAATRNTANSGIVQEGGHGGHGSSGQAAYQGGSLVNLPIQVNPSVNVGGILTGGDVTQTAGTENSSNSGISQQGGGHGGGHQTAVTGGSIVDALLQVNPALNVGGILTKGDVTQTAVTRNVANSGISQLG